MRGAHTAIAVSLFHQAAKCLVARGAMETGERFYWRSDPELMFNSQVCFSEEQMAALLAGISCPVLLITAKDGIVSQQLLRNRLVSSGCLFT